MGLHYTPNTNYEDSFTLVTPVSCLAKGDQVVIVTTLPNKKLAAVLMTVKAREHIAGQHRYRLMSEYTGRTIVLWHDQIVAQANISRRAMEAGIRWNVLGYTG
jgi:hypothetical protein